MTGRAGAGMWSTESRQHAAQARNRTERAKRVLRRQRFRQRYVYVPLMLAALALFWLRG